MHTRYYGQLLERKPSGAIDYALATDSQVHLDNRLSLKHMCDCIESRIDTLNDCLGRRYIGYKLMRGGITIAEVHRIDGVYTDHISATYIVTNSKGVNYGE